MKVLKKMFICQFSGQLSEPREKPVRLVTATRPVRYENLAEDGIKITSGTEIVSEINACLAAIDPEAARRLAEARRPIDRSIILAAAESRHEHARRCKKALEDCLLCKSNITFFLALPPATLSRVLEEPYWR